MSLTCKHMEWKEYPRVSRQGFDMEGRWTRTTWFEESPGTTPLLVLHRKFGRCSSIGSRPHSELDEGPEFARVSLATIMQVKLIERYRTRYRVYATKVANQKDMSRYSWIMESYVALRLLRSRHGSLLELLWISLISSSMFIKSEALTVSRISRFKRGLTSVSRYG